MAAARAFICGLSGTALSRDEAAFLRDARPFGVILFRRNADNPAQIRRLCADIREILGSEDAPVLVDQEGGRVQRIGPPHVRTYPAAARYGALYARNPLTGVEAAYVGAKLIALDLSALGISVNCAPVLDIPIAGTTAAIGDRAFGQSADCVATLGAAQVDGFLAGGVLPVMKHMPGHGRATVDSHNELPRVDATIAELEGSDFLPFRLLARRVPFGMTGHVLFLDVDDTAPATLSEEVIVNVIRSRIGFDGALMTDDISMGALSGEPASRAAAAIAAGCDLVLHCNGEMAEMEAVADAVGELAGEALRRADAALASRRVPEPSDHTALAARLDALLQGVAAA
jgi:beta-N-acetylhexosaminidase